MLLAGFAVISGGCRSGLAQCEALQLGTAVDELDTAPAFSAGLPRETKGPVTDVLCCRGCGTTGSCACAADCSQPFFREGKLLELPGSMETYEGYPELSNEYAICELWSFEGRVAAVWWAPMY
jgi:hypothetical protein